MRVHVEDLWQEDAVAIYVVDGRPVDRILRLEDSRVAFAGGGHWEGLEPDAIVATAPTLRLRRPVWDAIVAAGAELAPADRTMAAAWDDARAVRDRLLALVERVIPEAG